MIDDRRLGMPSNVLFYDSVDFFEDELSDNGISFCNVKVVWFIILSTNFRDVWSMASLSG